MPRSARRCSRACFRSSKRATTSTRAAFFTASSSAREGHASDIGSLMHGVVAVSSRGKPVKCKTVGAEGVRLRHQGQYRHLRRGACGNGQDLSCRLSRGGRLQGQAGGKDHPDPSRSGGGRKAGLPPRRSADQGRSIPAPRSTMHCRRCSGSRHTQSSWKRAPSKSRPSPICAAGRSRMPSSFWTRRRTPPANR